MLPSRLTSIELVCIQGSVHVHYPVIYRMKCCCRPVDARCQHVMMSKIGHEHSVYKVQKLQMTILPIGVESTYIESCNHAWLQLLLSAVIGMCNIPS